MRDVEEFSNKKNSFDKVMGPGSRKEMMTFLHNEFDAGPSDIVEVSLDKQANVMLLDSSNYEHYKQGQGFKYHGGLATNSPVQIVPPCQNRWHIVVDLGGYAGTVQAEVQVVQGANA